MEFTKERLRACAREKVNSLEFSITQTAFADSRAELEEELELARIALASLEAEPVHQVLTGDAWVDLRKGAMESQGRVGATVRTLNTAPPATVSVPDRSMFEKWWESEHGSPLDSWDSLRTTDGYCDDGIDGQFEAWNACRAAMLQGADGNSPAHSGCRPAQNCIPPAQCGNSPVISDGWVMVPVEPTEDMIVNGFESEPDESFSDEKEWEVYEAMSGCQQAAHRAKLCWAAMIAAAPKTEHK